MSTAIEKPSACLRRSQIYRWHHQYSAQFELVNQSAIVKHYGDPADEARTAARSGVCDLSLLTRTGFKGSNASHWLQQHCPLPAQPNNASQTADGGLVARLSNEEYLLIDPVSDRNGSVASIRESFSTEKPGRVYELPRSDSHCLFAITGLEAPHALAKLCAIDLQAPHFPEGAVAQTSVARLNAIVVRIYTLGCPVFYLLADVSAAEYLWHCVLDAIEEFSGAAIGTTALRSLISST